MDALTDIVRWVFDLRMNIWAVVVSAVVLAWLHRTATARDLENYDAWWVHYSRRARRPWPSFRSPHRR